jgi:hypothetical protein
MKRIYSFIRGRELEKDLKETRLGEGGWTGFIWLKTSTITRFFLNMVMNTVYFPLNYIIDTKNRYQLVTLYYLFVG